MAIFEQTLKNGIRLVFYPTKGAVTYCGMIINTGSRHENIEANEHGTAHFIEHTLFKGTKRRKSFRILSYLDDTGGELNAYTTKEETAVYASVLKEDTERAFDIIRDIVFNSVFPEKEIEKEKDVIVEEINSYLDTPSELIFDDFEDIVFKNHPLGHNILGNPETVKAMTVDRLKSFISSNYYTDEMVFAIVANMSEKTVSNLFRKYFDDVEAHVGRVHAVSPILYKPSSETKEADTYQAHCIIGNVAYPLKDNRRIGLSLLSNILAGQGLNSRLYMSLREKNGLVYTVESSYTPYLDAGIFTIYFGTEKEHLERGIAIVHSELNRLMSKPLGVIQLQKAKKQSKGYLARNYENYESLMLGLGKNRLSFDRLETIEEMYAHIDALTSADLLDIANEVFDPSRLSMLIYS